jgi:hypothetical protein
VLSLKILFSKIFILHHNSEHEEEAEFKELAEGLASAVQAIKGWFTDLSIVIHLWFRDIRSGKCKELLLK